MPSKSSKFTIEMIVGTGRYDGTGNEISMQLVGTDGAKTSHMPLGKGFKKGEVRSVTVKDAQSIGKIKSVVLTTSGKDGVTFSSILINRPVGSNTDGYTKASMSGALRCTGSKVRVYARSVATS